MAQDEAKPIGPDLSQGISLDQLAGIDPHGAVQGAGAVGRAGLQAVVVVVLEQCLQDG